MAVGDQFGKQFQIKAKLLSLIYFEEIQHLAKQLRICNCSMLQPFIMIKH